MSMPVSDMAVTDPVELRAALREHDKGWELDTEWQEVPPRQEEGGGQTLAQAQAQADASKARAVLDWEPKKGFRDLIVEMTRDAQCAII